jgi:beta-1,4-mannosyl-glycoprotein beta-1,4-N-acetylglucosaminyltransferase
MRRYIDTFPMHDELDLLELRLTELQDVPNLTHVIVEADVTHQDRPKPSYYRDNIERFSPWKDRIVHVWATGLPTAEENPDAWSREMAQREHALHALQDINPDPDDIILHGDLDEVPRAFNVINLPHGYGVTSFGQHGLFWAVDWRYPHWWWGTVACNARTLLHPFIWKGPGAAGPLSNLRNRRNIPSDPAALEPGGWAHGNPAFLMPGRSTAMIDAGWHLSWLGGADRAKKKVSSFCHPEVKDRLVEAIANDNRYFRQGVHIDGELLEPVDVDDTWPRWIVEGNAPESWFRRR